MNYKKKKKRNSNKIIIIIKKIGVKFYLFLIYLVVCNIVVQVQTIETQKQAHRTERGGGALDLPPTAGGEI